MKALSDIEDWSREHKKLTDLQLELLAVADEKAEILQKVGRRSGEEYLTQAVQELLAGGRPSMPTSDDDRLNKLRFQEKLLTAAIKVQADKLKTLESELSRQVCSEVQPVYDKLVAKIAKAANTLRDAIGEEEMLRGELERGGFSIGSLRIHPMYRAAYRLEYWIQEAQTNGFI